MLGIRTKINNFGIHQTLEETRQKLLEERLEVLELEALARMRLPDLSREIEFTVGPYQFGQNGHVFERVGTPGERFWGHLAYLKNEKVLAAWRGYLNGSPTQ